MRTLTEKYTENIGHGLFLNRTSSNHITCIFTLLSSWAYMAICYRNLEFFLRKMHLLSRFGKSLHLYFCNICFLAVENTLSDGAVDAGIAKYFLASLKIIGKDVSWHFHHVKGSSLRKFISTSFRYLCISSSMSSSRAWTASCSVLSEQPNDPH